MWQQLKNSKNRVRAAMAAGLALVGASAHAALPTAATEAFTDLSTAVTDVETAVWPVLGAVIVMFTIMKLVKRGSNKI